MPVVTSPKAAASSRTGRLDPDKIRQAIRLLLEGIGEDPDREGLVETPARFARMCEEIYAGIGRDPGEVIKVLKEPDHDEIVLVKDIAFTSMCEHHLLPFSGKAHVAYLPAGSRITGISKLARVVDVIARRPQVQERMTTAIADTVMDSLRPKGVIVVVEAEHLCMTMRGVRNPGSSVTTSVVRGCFRKNPATRAEALSLIYPR